MSDISEKKSWFDDKCREEDVRNGRRFRVFNSSSGRLIGEFQLVYCESWKFFMKLRRMDKLFRILDMISKSYFCDIKKFMRLILLFKKMYFLQRFELNEMISKCYFLNSKEFKLLEITVQRSVMCLGCHSSVYLPKIKCSVCVGGWKLLWNIKSTTLFP